MVVLHPHAGAVGQPESRGGRGCEHHGVACQPAERIDVLVHDAVELLASASDQHERVGVAGPGVGDGLVEATEACPTSGRSEGSSVAQTWSADLELIAGVGEALAARVLGDDLGDLGADGRRRGEAQVLRQARPGAGGDLAQHVALGARLGDARPGNLRAEGDAPLGRGLADAAWHLVAGRRRQQQHGVVRVVEHRRVQRQVEVHPQRHAGQRRRHARGVREHLPEAAADGQQHVDLAARGGVDHRRRRDTRPGRDGEPVVPLQRRRGVGVDRHAAGEHGGVGAHLGAALDAGVAADGHQPTAGTPDEAAGQRQVDDRLDVLLALRLMGQTHAPDEDAAVGATDQLGVRDDLGARHAALALDARPVEALEVVAQVAPAGGVLGDEGLVEQPELEDGLERAPEEGAVAAGRNLDEAVGDGGAEERALDVGGYPVGVHAALSVGVDHHDLRARLLRVVEVLHHHGLVLGRVRADEGDDLAADEVGVAAGGGADAERALQGDRARRVA